MLGSNFPSWPRPLHPCWPITSHGLVGQMPVHGCAFLDGVGHVFQILRAVPPLPRKHVLHDDIVEHGKVFEHHEDLMAMLGIVCSPLVDAPMALEHLEERMSEAPCLRTFDVA